MTERRRWQVAFLEQARSDWDAFQRTRDTIWPQCHRLHFLQMATEKLGKALLLAGHSKLDSSGNIHVPAQYSFSLTKRLQTPQAISLLKHIERFISEFEKLFLN